MTRFCRFKVDGIVSYGVAEGDVVYRSETFGGAATRLDVFPLKDVELLAPAVASKVVAVGLNYKDHITEFGRTEIPSEPVIFLKAPSALIGHDHPIVLPKDIGQVDYEAELGVVILKTARRVSESTALEHVLGYTCVNDVTARALQKKDVQWARAKSYDSFAPVGPWITSGLDWRSLAVGSRVNGEEKQKGNTRDMIFSVPFLVSFISNVMTLFPGDIISTGTPVGVGPLKAGDVVEVTIEGVGTLRNPVVGE
jgi:2-keto-4-pentenoate hydratase/2-oxohepta-3-ene-1,7-dioic acid hydratase in catechol pathway